MKESQLNYQCWGLFLLASLLSGCQFLTPGVRGSGVVVREVRDLAAFDRVSVSGGVNIEILSGQAESSCIVECDNNLLEDLVTTVEDGQLAIQFRRSVTTSQPLRVWLTAEHLSKLSVSGSAHGSIDGLNEPSMEVDVSGSAELLCTGRVDRLVLVASGSATFDCFELAADEVSVNISGSGKANVQANRRLAIVVAGSGDVRYLGSPEIEKQILGSGSVKPAPR